MYNVEIIDNSFQTLATNEAKKKQKIRKKHTYLF